ncbi:MAG: PAS domain S-box protein [Proteobacteria bacterium]|nr:PAS domain S-box protein [Pseudomonadota bacterium]
MPSDPSNPAPASLSSLAWRQIVDSATDTAIISIDRDGRVVTWSEGARRILGWTDAEMIGRDLSRLFIDDDRATGRLAREMSDALLHGRGGGDEGWRARSDGSRVWAIGELTPIRDESGAHVGFVKVLRDRTLQRRVEEELAEERRALEVLNRASSTLAVETDLHRMVQAVVDAGVALSGAEFGAFFYNVLDANGESYMLYALSGAPAEAFAQFPMPRNTEVFAATFSGAGIVRSDDITADPRYGRNAPLRGMPPGHLPVRSYLAVPVVSHASGVLGGLFFGHATPGVFGERSERGLEGLAGEAAVAIDNARLAQERQLEIDERRKAEEALRELNATLEQQVQQRTEELHRNAETLRQSQKMEVVGQLTGGVAHDFNNLLQIIVGNLEVLRRGLPHDAGRLLRAANSAMGGARRAASLTRRLLAFARRQPLDPKPIDVNALVAGMSELLHRTLGETIMVETVLGAAIWRTEADPNELEAAILNLAVNARDAMPDGGGLTIETANAQLDAAYAAAHAEATAGDYVVMSIADTGSGMDEATLRQAFEPFFTTKPVGKGTGLGLSQVYGFVRQSGGHVRIDSALDIGTTVRIYLPRLVGAAPVEQEADEALLPASAPQETILVVEDDDDVRTNSVETLRDLGYRVIEAHDGASALSLLERQQRVDLLFSDIVLPGGMTGAQVAAEATALRPGLKVLFTTGYARDAIVHGGRLDKGLHLLQKPFTHAELAGKVRDVLDASNDGPRG